MVWSWYSGTLAFLRHDPLFMHVQDSEQVFAQRNNIQTSIVHEINNDNTEIKKKKTESQQHDNTDQSQSSASSTIIFIQ